MSLIKCPECGRENVSDTALACPQCGFNIDKHTKTQAYIKEKEEPTEMILTNTTIEEYSNNIEKEKELKEQYNSELYDPQSEITPTLLIENENNNSNSELQQIKRKIKRVVYFFTLISAICAIVSFCYFNKYKNQLKTNSTKIEETEKYIRLLKVHMSIDSISVSEYWDDLEESSEYEDKLESLESERDTLKKNKKTSTIFMVVSIISLIVFLILCF